MTDSEEFETYKQKRKEWVQALAPGDGNSIFNQIGNMLWNAAFFNVVNEARARAPLNEGGKPKLNPMFHHFVDECFFQSQLMGVRRLADKAFLQGKRGVWSLGALLEDIKKHNSFLTRKNIICSQFEEYNPDVIKAKHQEWMISQYQKGIQVGWVPPELDDYPLEYRHQQVDELSGVEKANRKENDKVSIEILDDQIDRLKNVTQKMGRFADKYIAHSATKFSREQESAESIEVTLEELYAAYQVICQVGMFISDKIVGDPHSFILPYPQFDIWEYIDSPLFNSAQINELESIWIKYASDIEAWSH